MITGGGGGGPGSEALTRLPEARVFGGGPRLSVNAGTGGSLPLTGTQVPSWGAAMVPTHGGWKRKDRLSFLSPLGLSHCLFVPLRSPEGGRLLAL